MAAGPHDPSLGWIWVPGTEFSPGWVVWRTNPHKIGWAPTPPDEDVKTLSAADFDQSDVWTFMDVGTFAHGCAATAPPPAASVKTLIRETAYVHDLKTVGGIAVIVLPSYVIGDLVDFDVAFDPWPIGFAGQILSDWNGVWNASPVAMLCPPSSPLSVAPLPPKVIRVLPQKAAIVPPPKAVIAPTPAPTKAKPFVHPKDPMSADPMGGPPQEFYDPPPRFRPQRPYYGQGPSGYQDQPPRFRPQRPVYDQGPSSYQDQPPRFRPQRPVYDQGPSGYQDQPPRFRPQRPGYGRDPGDFEGQRPNGSNALRRRWPLSDSDSGFGRGPSVSTASPTGGTTVGGGYGTVGGKRR